MNIIDEGLSFGNMKMNNDPNMFIVHHLEAKGSQWTVQKIHDMHITEKGWAGIGYHYYIRLDGRIYKGRPDKAVGAHCQGCNTNTLGISFEGTYDNADMIMPVAQFNAWCELKKYLCELYGDLPIFGHKEKGTSGSSCPGRYFPLEKVRKASARTGAWKKCQDGIRWWYSYSDATFSTGWDKIDGIWYLFDNDGYMLTGWQKSKGKDYYLFSNGSMAIGWQKIGDKYYYFNPDGDMKTGWLQDNDWFYLDSDGVMQTGWKEIDGTHYYFYSTGQMAHDTTIDGDILNSNGQYKK